MYPSSQLPTLPDYVIMPVYFILLCIIGWAIFLEGGYELIGMFGGMHDFPNRLAPFPIKSRKGRKTPRFMYYFTVLIWTISVIQVIAALISGERLFWISPTISLFIILAERSSSRRHSYLLRVLPKYFILVCVLAVTVSLFTGFALFLSDSEAFQNLFLGFDSGLWNMMMILLGSNWPGPIIPIVEV